MNETKLLVQKITEGIQEKKGKNIVIADLTNIGDTSVSISSFAKEIPPVKFWLLQIR